MEKIKLLIDSVVKELYGQDVLVELSRPDEQFGDFASNVALKLAASSDKNPRQIAEEIKVKLTDEIITKVEVAGPGFLNITLSNNALIELTNQSDENVYKEKSIVIETNNPNPFKAMHIGHAFNAILGDTIANLIEKGGANIYRVSYHGDVGTHVGRSMYSLLRFVDGKPEKLDEIAPEDRNSFMSKMYTEGSKASKEDESAKAEIEKLAQMSFTREDPIYSAVYDRVFEWSFKQIDATVKRLGNKPVIERFLESDAENRGLKIVKDNVPEVFKESSGAIIFEGSKYGSFDNVFVSKHGTGLYGSRDIGLIQLKNEQYHPYKSYIVTAEEQRDYFKGVLAAADLAMPEIKGQTVNISTGTVKLTTGKMSSRDGGVIEIEWLFDQVSEAIKANGGNSDDKMIASALRYEFLKVRIGSDVVFDVNEAVSLHGNSGPYLQYAHARARSILSKAGSKGSLGDNLEKDERSLVLKLGQYNEVVDLSINELMPHHVCNYLHELAQQFNKFYEKNRVVGDPRQDLRLGIVSLYANTLKNGLELLGIHAPESM